MGQDRITRRTFMQGSGAVAGSTLARISVPAALAAAQAACSARDEEAAFKTLSPDEAADLEAIAARILPTTETPGAREAGVVYFFDTPQEGQIGGALKAIRGMLPAFQAAVAEQHGGGARFADLGEAEQDALLAEHEQTPFFQMARSATLIGFFAMEKYGGNKDYLSWDLIGFDGHAASQPPFGYYDAEYTAEGETDGA